MKILAIGAHPDDIEFGCGGTLISYAEKGHTVYLLVMTKGESGGDTNIRENEQRSSAEIIGVERVFWGGYTDTEIPTDKACIQEVETVVKSTEPDFIFVNYFDDTHQDHRNLASCVLSATRYTRNVLFYEVPTTQHFTPTVFVNIDHSLKNKFLTLKAHTSQVLKTNIEGLSIIDLARSSAHFRGIQGRIKNAEGFVPLRLFINIG
jgi:LmbE family N-acetylglucosaminyl deacetylase